MNSESNVEGRSFLWAFGLFGLLFFGPSLLGNFLNIPIIIHSILMTIAGFIPFTIQFLTGYALNGWWVATYSRSKQSKKYWVLILMSLIIAAWFTFGAYSIYIDSINAANS